jgi:5-(carboxyamino)imidazole ribonucleotide synthase
MLSEKKIGILGGGQLGRMLIEAALPLNLDISVLDASISYPAGAISSHFTEGDFNNYEDVVRFGSNLDVITIEIESVNVKALKTLEAMGKKVYPQPRVLDIINDKGVQKQFYLDNGLQTAPFSFFNSKQEILDALNSGKLTFPFVNKIRVGGYDGKGVSVINSTDDLPLIFDAPSIVESKVHIQKEMAISVTRSESGEIAVFPMVEMEFHPTANLVELLFCPSNISKELQQEAEKMCIEIAAKLEIVGLLAIEMFLDEENNIIINEMAPRPHNSAHHTIEACVTSQFDQLWRAILGLKLGETTLSSPAVMINLLGEDNHSGKVFYQGLEEAYNLNGVYPHLYGKSITKPKRKMGHITIINQDLDKAISIAKNIKNTVKVISK